MSEECCIQEWKRCCCNCKHHLADFHHCTTSKELREEKKACVCRIQKGWICAAPEFEGCFSGWSEHGMCEMHDYKDVAPQRQDNETNVKESP